jgi:predicted  nucleic acid-binding Zn-ribbon protein
MSDDTVERRLDTVEEQLEELDTDTIESRLDAIETEQSQLRSDITNFVEAYHEENKEIPHIDSVEALYHRLQTVEEDIATLRGSLEELVDESR